MLKNGSAGGGRSSPIGGWRAAPNCVRKDSPKSELSGSIPERHDNLPLPAGAEPALNPSSSFSGFVPRKPESVPARVYKQLWELSEELREMRSLEDFMAAFLPGAAAMINAGSAAFCLHAKAPGAVTIPAKGLGWNLCGPSGTLSLACRDFFLQDPLFTHFREFRESGEAYRVIASSGMIAPPRLSDPEFFCEFLWPLRQSEYIGLFVNNVMDSSGYFGFHRPPGAGCFGAREKRVLAIMAPRLREIIPWSDERSEPWSARDEAVPHPNFGMRKMGGGPRRKGLEMNG